MAVGTAKMAVLGGFEAFLGRIRLTCRGPNLFKSASMTHWKYGGASRIQKFEFSNGLLAVRNG